MVRGHYSVKAAEVKRLCAGHLVPCIERRSKYNRSSHTQLFSRVWKDYLGIRDLTPNLVQDSGKRKILRDLTATLEVGFAKILARDAVLGKKNPYMVFGIEMTKVPDVRLSWKRDQTPPPHPPRPCSIDRVLPRRGPDTSTIPYADFMEDKLQHAVSKLLYMCSSKRRGRLREVVAQEVRL